MKALIFFLIALLAFSHDLWIEKDAKGFVLRYGHIKPKMGEEAFVKYDPSKVIVSECFNHTGEKVKTKVDKTYPYRLEANCAIVYVVYSSGYWTKTLEGTKNVPKDKLSDAIESWLSYESVKSIYVWSPNFSKPLTDGLEIVPLENPLHTPVGKKIEVMVFYNRKPVENVTVLYNGQAIGTTDSGGKIRLKVKEKGMNIISAVMKDKGDGVKADYVVRNASLQFEVR